MFTIDYRPSNMNDIIGQSVPKMVLKKVLQNPEGAPKTFMLCGPWGTGKTLIAQVFGKIINCSGVHKPCNVCNNCTDLKLYQELDSSIMGNVKAVRDMRDSWYYKLEKGWRVIVIDEIQIASNEALGGLLKILENPPDSTFFFLLTTDPDKIMNTIKSRSMILDFNVLSDKELTVIIDRILKLENSEISTDVREVVVRRAMGHARDCVSLLEQALILGEVDFLGSVRLNDKDLRKFFGRVLHLDKEASADIAKSLCSSPVNHLRIDLERFFVLLMDKVMGEGKVLYKGKLDQAQLSQFFNYYIRVKPILNQSSSDFYSALMGFMSVVNTRIKPQSVTRPSRFVK